MISISKILLYINTVRYLKPVQIFARGVLFFRKVFPYRQDWSQYSSLTPQKLTFIDSIHSTTSNSGTSFEFLNLKKNFDEQIDWNFFGYGRLWMYNLNYFEYLNQKGISSDEGVQLIDNFIFHLPNMKIGMEPYPLSLRCINWIRFFIKHKIYNAKFDSILFNQLNLLTHKLEYHLLGNHLLENGFALLFGAYYFNERKLYAKAKKILVFQLEEQILQDGCHFELSPMYHCTMLFRLLDCYNLISNNKQFDMELKLLFKEKCELMLAWLNNITFKNGNIPLMNDSAFNIAPNHRELIDYALRLELDIHKKVELNHSGYRKFINNKFELLVDVGSIKPDYQPGHAHADTFTFELYVNGKPIVVDTGTSTYIPCKRRKWERGTTAHNTVSINGDDSAEVWGSHRVARRPEIFFVEDNDKNLQAFHNGYRKYNLHHRRLFNIQNFKEFQIIDSIEAIKSVKDFPFSDLNINTRFHFHPDVEVELDGTNLSINGNIKISFTGSKDVSMHDYFYAPEFNKLIKAKFIKVEFSDQLISHIVFE